MFVTTLISLLVKPEVIVAITSIISIFVTYIVAPYISEHAKKLFNKSPDKVKDELLGAEKVYNKLTTIMSDVGCDKIWIKQFHNGANFLYNSKSMQKFSMIFEQTNCGIQKTQEGYQNIPIHLYYKYITQVINNSFLAIDFTRLETPKYDMEGLSQIYGIKTLYSFPIYSIDDNLLGILGLEFINNSKELSQTEIHDLLGDAGSIGGILQTSILKK